MASPVDAIDQAKLDEFLGRFVGDLGAALSAALVVIGDRLGLYRAMGDGAPVSAEQLAERTATDPALRARMAVQPGRRRVRQLRPRQRGVLSHARAVLRAGAGGQPGVHTGSVPGRDRGDQGRGEDRAGVPDRQRGGMARAPPRPVRGNRAVLPPRVRGQPHPLVDPGARRRAGQARAGRTRGRRWAAVTAPRRSSWPKRSRTRSSSGSTITRPQSSTPARPPSRPVSRIGSGSRSRRPRSTRAALRAGGDVRLPARHGRPGRRRRPRPRQPGPRRDLADRRALRRRSPRRQPNPVGRVYYGASTLICTPASRAQEVGLALGAQAGEARLSEVVSAGGFTRFRRATETPFNLVLEARP